MDKIPLIDASLLNSTNKDVRNKTVKNLYDAFSSIGFVSLTATEINPDIVNNCLLYTSPSPRDRTRSRMPSSA